MKRIDIDRLQPGDIILTASSTKAGKAVRMASRGIVSHAMICVQHGSIIDSTADGVQAWNLQREFFSDDEEIFGFRLRHALPPVEIARVVDFARSEIGARYSKAEAARSVLGGPKPRNNRQFCSRLVARAYASVGIELVPDEDYCTPEDLRLSPMLVEIEHLVEAVTPEEIAAMANRPNPLQRMRESQNAVLNAARQLDPRVENFTDLDRLVREHPEWDSAIAQAYRDSGYLDLWRHEIEAHPYRYDIALMESIIDPAMMVDVRAYCVETIREAYSGGMRFAVNLTHYQSTQDQSERETLGLLIDLYETLVRNNERRVETARAWLLRHHPDDVLNHMERVIPHSELWFSIVDRVEPRLGAIARVAIQAEQSLEVCSSCGDPAHDYRVANAAEAMPGVPSLRLCLDCVAIRRNFGEQLDEMDWSASPRP
jgi:Permuted papain-like amidase enzyme, YaeF/YiiX, C92 family